MNRIASLIIWKLKAMVSSKNHFSANVMDSNIDSTAAVRNHVRVYHATIGRYSYVARNTLIQNATIGSFCSISEGCNIGMPSHPTHFVSTSPVFLRGGNYLRHNFSDIAYEDCPKTKIGNDVWIGAHASIKSGITIGNGAIIGAGAVVTKDVPAYAIVVGVPAKIMKYRFDEDTCNKLNHSRWWELPDDELARLAEDFAQPDQFLSKAGSKKN